MKRVCIFCGKQLGELCFIFRFAEGLEMIKVENLKDGQKAVCVGENDRKCHKNIVLEKMV
jgi:hypothetical protein